MQEIFEFRIFKDYYGLLSKPNSAVFNGAVYVLKVKRNDLLFNELRQLDQYVRLELGGVLYSYATVHRKYKIGELNNSKLFHVWADRMFEPEGEECGTVYDESVACEFCGAGRKQLGPLILKNGIIPKKDIARTIAGETIVSDKFVANFNKRRLKGAVFEPVIFKNSSSSFYQLTAPGLKFELTDSTLVRQDIFNDFPTYEDQSWWKS